MMKQLSLIIIALCYCSFVAIAQQDTLHASDSSHKKEQKNGYVEFRWSNGDVYKGDWVADKMSGYGIYTWANGEKYMGDWKDDTRNGNGIMLWLVGSRYEGEWKDGEKNGHGVQMWANDDAYDGEWVRGMRTGYGEYKWASGKKFVGQFNNSYQTFGTESYPEGGIYNGQFAPNPNKPYVDGGTYWSERNGQGVFIFSDGSRYSGDWKVGHRTGQGEYLWPDGKRYVGTFNDGYHVYGKETYSDGSIYEGDYQADSSKPFIEDGMRYMVRTGHGVYLYTDGTKYVGEWKDNKRSGLGKLYNTKGRRIQKGMWVDNKYVGK